MSDAALLAAAQRGDSEALTGLIERYSPRILRFGMKMCRHEDDAREVLQDTLLAAARSVREFRGQSSLSTWLYTIARSFCVKHRRRNVGEPANLEPIHELKAELTPALVDLRTPEGEAASREVAAVLEEAILELDPIYREVLLLRDVEGLSAVEVAQVVGASVDAVKSRLHRARALVRLRLAPLLRSESEARSAGEACPDVVELLSRHLEHEIGSEVCREMEGHVAGCAHCASRCDSLRKVLALCEAAPLPQLAPELKHALKAQMSAALVELRR